MSYFTFFFFLAKSLKSGLYFTCKAHFSSECSYFKCSGASCGWRPPDGTVQIFKPLQSGLCLIFLSHCVSLPVGHTPQILCAKLLGWVWEKTWQGWGNVALLIRSLRKLPNTEPSSFYSPAPAGLLASLRVELGMKLLLSYWPWGGWGGFHFWSI